VNVPDWMGASSDSVANRVNVHMSFALYQKFQSFPVNQVYPLPSPPSNHEITFVVEYTNLNRLAGSAIFVGAPQPKNWIALSQDANYPSSVSPFFKLVITTTSLPIIAEQLNRSLVTAPQGGPANVTQKILTDFLIDSSNEIKNINGQPLVYIPELYRQVGMYGSEKLTQWDLTFQTVTDQGGLFPFFLAPGGIADIKLVFIRKRVPP
jgi:hypothetical protein